MADGLVPPDDVDGTTRSPGQEALAGMPRWVKVFAVIGVILVVLLLIGLLVGGKHGPGRHFGDAGGSARAAAFDSDAAHEVLAAASARG